MLFCSLIRLLISLVILAQSLWTESDSIGWCSEVWLKQLEIGRVNLVTTLCVFCLFSVLALVILLRHVLLNGKRGTTVRSLLVRGSVHLPAYRTVRYYDSTMCSSVWAIRPQVKDAS